MKIDSLNANLNAVPPATMRRWQYVAWAYFILAALSLLLTWHYPLIHEEGNYTTLVVDMMQHHRWLQPFFMGQPYPRPPLMSWLAAPWVWLFGYHSTLTVLRVLTVIYTTATAGILVWFVKKEYAQAHPLLPILSGCLFLSGDVLFIRGWLAYSDPLVALCVFSSMVLLYRALRCEKLLYLAWSLLLVFLGYLAKEPTAYVFYALTGLAIVCSGIGVRFAFRWQTLCLGLVGLLLPYFAWHVGLFHFGLSSQGDVSQRVFLVRSWSQFFHPLTKLMLHELLRYNFILLLIVVASFFISKPLLDGQRQRALVLILLINIAPYILLRSDCGLQLRYFLPLMPWFAIFGAQIILRCSSRFTLWLLIILWSSLCWKCILSIGGRMLFHGLLISVSRLDSTPVRDKILAQVKSQETICVRENAWYGMNNPLYSNLDMALAALRRSIIENHKQPLPQHCSYQLSEQPLLLQKPTTIMGSDHLSALGGKSLEPKFVLLQHYQWGIVNRHGKPRDVYLYRKVGAAD